MGGKKEKKNNQTRDKILHSTPGYWFKKKIVSANCFMFINFTKSSKETHASPGGSFQKAWQAVRPLRQT